MPARWGFPIHISARQAMRLPYNRFTVRPNYFDFAPLYSQICRNEPFAP